MQKSIDEQVIKNWLDGEIKTADEMCKQHIKRVDGHAGADFLLFAKAVHIEAIRRGTCEIY